MQINFKKELEAVTRNMIMIHDPKRLIKLIVRMIVNKLKVNHAAMLLFEPDEDAYILSVSRGDKDTGIPKEFTSLKKGSPLIRLFRQKEFKPLTIKRSAIVSEDINRMIWRESVIEHLDGTKELLHKVDAQLQMLNSAACVPSYYQHKLMAVLLLGEKQDETPFDQNELDFLSALTSDAAMAIRNAQLFDRLKKEAAVNRRQFIQMIIVLSSAIEVKDAYTHGHTERATKYSLAIAKQMVNNGSAQFPENFFENLYISSLLHDIGKIGISEGILNKNGKLTSEEYQVMKEHPAKGVEIVKSLNLPEECLGGIMSHHENYDGTGYPQGLKGDDIPIFASIISVADTFDAMTSNRPYRNGKSKEWAMDEIKRYSGTQFHPSVVTAMLELHVLSTG